jgi:cyclopropane fatty-acyl-phospholipid synthase-like methyltransferase
MTDDVVLRRYLTGRYAACNPDWDSGDSPWKAERVADMIRAHSLEPSTVVEVGCGAGGVLVGLRRHLPEAGMTGFDIAPDLRRYWEGQADSGITFELADYLATSHPVPDLTLVLDVLEHLADPFDFLSRLKNRSRDVIFHIPLDLSAMSVARETPLMLVRRKVGHLHFYTKALALEMIEECGFEVVEARYTGAAFSAPQRGREARLVGLLRRVAFSTLGDLGVRLLGGETLLVLARPRSHG